MDLRARKLAQLAVKYSVKAKKGDKVIISGDKESLPFMTELYKTIILQGAIPIIRFAIPDVNNFFYKYSNKEQLEHFPGYWFDTVKQAQAYIGIVTDANTRELTTSDSKKLAIRQKIIHPISDYIVNNPDKIRRVAIAFPCISHAQEAEMSMNEWENFVFDSCLGVNWQILGKKLDKINSLFNKARKVHLIGEGIDLKLELKGKSVADKGEENMPGGEIFIAPVRESLQGWIKFDYPSIYNGKEVSGIYLKFEQGKAIEAKADKNEDLLKEILNLDKNSSYVGELGIGCNPKIKKFTKELLFDEKISGTIHLALGMAYKQNGGGNDSAVHWDIVKDMHKGKIILDNKVIQENGIWKI
jgi:aminopeptidase